MEQEFTLHSWEFFQHDDLKLELIERDPQIPFPLHTHDFSELVIVLSGTGIHFTYGDEYQIAPGDVFYIESGFAHGYKDTRKLHLYNILFDPSLLGRGFIDITHMPGYHSIFHVEPKYRENHRFESRLQLTEEQIASVTALIDALRQELTITSLEEGSKAMAMAYFIELVVNLSRFYGAGVQKQNSEISALSRVLSYMEQRRDRQISLQELIDRSYMSYSTLNRAFRQATGYSPIEYHIRLRIRDACRKLVSSPLPITEIAYQCGFEDSNYFSRQFKKMLGVTPRSYRRAQSHIEMQRSS